MLFFDLTIFTWLCHQYISIWICGSDRMNVHIVFRCKAKHVTRSAKVKQVCLSVLLKVRSLWRWISMISIVLISKYFIFALAHIQTFLIDVVCIQKGNNFLLALYTCLYWAVAKPFVLSPGCCLQSSCGLISAATWLSSSLYHPQPLWATSLFSTLQPYTNIAWVYFSCLFLLADLFLLHSSH